MTLSESRNIQEKLDLRNRLQNGSHNERYMATVEIGRRRDPFFIPSLMTSLRNDPDAGVYQNAASSVGKIGTDEAVQALIVYLEHNFAIAVSQRFHESELRIKAALEVLYSRQEKPEVKYVFR
jgi:HEAT repeat protein